MKKLLLSLVLGLFLLQGNAFEAPARSGQQQSIPDESDLQSHHTYVNKDGNVVHSPSKIKTRKAPEGASARCGDGSYSFSQHRRGTCSHHGGVAAWL
jgi:hypothetical protein